MVTCVPALPTPQATGKHAINTFDYNARVAAGDEEEGEKEEEEEEDK